MKRYLLYRVCLIPMTLIGVLVFNFCFLSLTIHQQEKALFEHDEHYLSPSFDPSHALKEHFALHLPLWMNKWKNESLKEVKAQIDHSFLTYQAKIPFHQAQLSELVTLYPNDEKVLEAYLELISLQKEYPLDKRPQTRLQAYLRCLLKLDFGPSDFFPNEKVSQVITRHLKVSLPLLIPSVVICFLLSLCLGGFLAYFQNRKWVFFVNLLLLLSYALPIYLLAPFLVDYFVLSSNSLNPFTSKVSIYPLLSKTLIALFCLSYSALAIYTRLSQSLFIKAQQKLHVLVAQASGVSPKKIWSVHLFKEVLASYLPLYCGSVHLFFVGILLVENLLEIKGFGYLFYHALVQKDLAIILSCIFYTSLLTLVSHIGADFFTFFLDPRVRSHDYPAYKTYS